MTASAEIPAPASRHPAEQRCDTTRRATIPKESCRDPPGPAGLYPRAGIGNPRATPVSELISKCHGMPGGDPQRVVARTRIDRIIFPAKLGLRVQRDGDPVPFANASPVSVPTHMTPPRPDESTRSLRVEVPPRCPNFPIPKIPAIAPAPVPRYLPIPILHDPPPSRKFAAQKPAELIDRPATTFHPTGTARWSPKRSLRRSNPAPRPDRQGTGGWFRAAGATLEIRVRRCAAPTPRDQQVPTDCVDRRPESIAMHIGNSGATGTRRSFSNEHSRSPQPAQIVAIRIAINAVTE